MFVLRNALTILTILNTKADYVRCVLVFLRYLQAKLKDSNDFGKPVMLHYSS